MSVEQPSTRKRPILVTVAWLWVSVPFAYGVYSLSTKVAQLLHN